jgi:hypothetical protein
VEEGWENRGFPRGSILPGASQIKIQDHSGAFICLLFGIFE